MPTLARQIINTLQESANTITDKSGRVWTVQQMPYASGVLYVIRKSTGFDVASLAVIRQGERRIAQDLMVASNYQRRGIATALWSYVEQREGQLTPSPVQRPDGKAFLRGLTARK